MSNKGQRILVIDDDNSTREILALVLQNAGYEVQVSEDNFLDLKMIDCLPDLIILDYNLGQKKGSEICKELKAGLETSHIRIILISAMDNIKHLAADSCADDYIAKPFGIQLLLEKIEKVLYIKETRTSDN